MEPNPFRISFVLVAVALGGVASCRSNAGVAENAASVEQAPQAASTCREQGVAATLIVLSVPAIDDAGSRRIETELADEYRAGIISALADPAEERVVILARADSGFTVDAALELLESLGFEAREADDATYDAAQAELGSRTLSIPVSSGSQEPPAEQGALESLEDSLSLLRSRFNEDRGRLRFIAILSPT